MEHFFMRQDYYTLIFDNQKTDETDEGYYYRSCSNRKGVL